MIEKKKKKHKIYVENSRLVFAGYFPTRFSRIWCAKKCAFMHGKMRTWKTSSMRVFPPLLLLKLGNYTSWKKNAMCACVVVEEPLKKKFSSSSQTIIYSMKEEETEILEMKWKCAKRGAWEKKQGCQATPYDLYQSKTFLLHWSLLK